MAPPVATLLPALRPRVKYDGVPLRYEETKPVLIQAGAHRKILYIGEELHDREIQQLTREQEKAVYMAQETIWEQAEAMRVEAVEKALHVAQDEHETAMRRMARAHERTLREEVTRIEGEAEIKFREQLAQEKITCDANLRRELDAMEIRWQDRLAEALNAIRIMEREKAEARVLQAEREEEVRTNQALEELGAKHEKAMTELSQSYDVLVSEEIEKAKQEAAEKSETRINNTRDLYEQQLQVLRTHISEKNELIAKLQAALNGLVLERARLKTQLEHTHKEFETFVNSAIPVQDAAGFLLPSFRTKPN